MGSSFGRHHAAHTGTRTSHANGSYPDAAKAAHRDRVQQTTHLGETRTTSTTRTAGYCAAWSPTGTASGVHRRRPGHPLRSGRRRGAVPTPSAYPWSPPRRPRHRPTRSAPTRCVRDSLIEIERIGTDWDGRPLTWPTPWTA